MDVFRDHDGVLYVPTDGYGSSSVLWASRDDGRTWIDTGGRTHGRHTSFQLLRDGRILGMGGKKSNIDGYMPKSISADGGKTWEIGKTPFSELGSGQRPSLIRLHSGRLFFCGDFQHRTGRHPAGIKQRGAYVALSDDEGENWHIKKLPGVLSNTHENLYPSLGYAVAKQAPNGLIHIVGSKTAPLLHFEINEAWIFDKEAGFSLDHKPKLIETIEDVDYYTSGKLKATRKGGITEEGEYVLHDKQAWYFEDGGKQWEVTYAEGRKMGEEIFWNDRGEKLWSWNHRIDGSSDWTQYWPNGNKKSGSVNILGSV